MLVRLNSETVVDSSKILTITKHNFKETKITLNDDIGNVFVYETVDEVLEILRGSIKVGVFNMLVQFTKGGVVDADSIVSIIETTSGCSTITLRDNTLIYVLVSPTEAMNIIRKERKILTSGV